MQAIVVEKIGEFAVREIEAKQPGQNEVLLKVSVTGLCRTDLKLIRAGHRDLILPRIPGEEVVGNVVALGPGVSDLWKGQRVYVYPGKSCGTCDMCKAGAENLCRSMEIMGFHRDGGFAEYVVAPAQSIIPIADSITDAEAVFAEPLSCCLNALELARPARGATVAIWGGGPAGSLLYRAALAQSLCPVAIDPDRARAQRIQGFLAPPQTLFDVCIVAVGSADAYREALSHLKPRGQLIVFSGLAPDSATLPIDFNELHYREQTIAGAYGCSFRHGEEALRLITNRAVPVKDLVSHSMALTHLDEALSLVERRECMKIHLYPVTQN